MNDKEENGSRSSLSGVLFSIGGSLRKSQKLVVFDILYQI